MAQANSIKRENIHIYLKSYKYDSKFFDRDLHTPQMNDQQVFKSKLKASIYRILSFCAVNVGPLRVQLKMQIFFNAIFYMKEIFCNYILYNNNHNRLQCYSSTKNKIKGTVYHFHELFNFFNLNILCGYF